MFVCVFLLNIGLAFVGVPQLSRPLRCMFIPSLPTPQCQISRCQQTYFPVPLLLINIGFISNKTILPHITRVWEFHLLKKHDQGATWPLHKRLLHKQNNNNNIHSTYTSRDLVLPCTKEKLSYAQTCWTISACARMLHRDPVEQWDTTLPFECNSVFAMNASTCLAPAQRNCCYFWCSWRLLCCTVHSDEAPSRQSKAFQRSIQAVGSWFPTPSPVNHCIKQTHSLLNPRVKRSLLLVNLHAQRRRVHCSS